MRATIISENFEECRWNTFCSAWYSVRDWVVQAGRCILLYYACTIVNQWRSYPTVHEGCHSNCSMNTRNHNAQTCEWDGSVELIVFVVRSVMYSSFQTFTMFWMLYAFFWVFPQCLNFICRCFGTLCSIFIPTRLWRWNRQCSETSAYKIQTLGNYAEESIQQISNGSSTVTPPGQCSVLEIIWVFI